ncbi:MAG: glycosyltransferase family 2 protein, partial [Planctomycetota bacterium]
MAIPAELTPLECGVPQLPQPRTVPQRHLLSPRRPGPLPSTGSYPHEFLKPLTVIILTWNEERHLERCLENVRDHVQDMIVVDSGSTDRTQDIARAHGARVLVHPFRYQADQFNWALDHVGIHTEWILRLDADEYLLPELWNEIRRVLPTASIEIQGYTMKRRVLFMN